MQGAESTIRRVCAVTGVDDAGSPMTSALLCLNACWSAAGQLLEGCLD